MHHQEDHPFEGRAIARAPSSPPLLPAAALAFAAGVGVAIVLAPLRDVPTFVDGVGAWRFALLGIALLAGMCARIARRRGAHEARSGRWMAVAWLCLGCLWTESHRPVIEPTGGMRLTPAESRLIRSRAGPPRTVPPGGALVTLTGTIRGGCRNGPTATDLINPSRPDQTIREADLDDVIVAGTPPFTVDGSVVLRVASSSWACRDGERVVARGWLHAPGPRRNPRANDGAPERPALLSAAMGDRRRVEGWLMVPDARLVAPASERALHTDRASAFDLARRNARAAVRSALDDARPTWSADGSGPDAWRLLATMLLGDGDADAAQPPGMAASPPSGEIDTDEIFAAAGLTHLIAISGFNLAVLAGAVHWCGSVVRIGRRTTAAIATLLVAAYAIIVEPQASVTRSAVCAIGVGVAVVCARRWNGGSVLALAALLILIADPMDLLRPGFQLTFAAVLALRSLAPALHERWYGNRAPPETLAELLPHATRSLLTTTIAVWLVTTPIAVWHFGRVAPFAIPLSVLAIPLGSLVLVAGYAAAGLALLSPTIAAPVAALASFLASTLLVVAQVGSGAAELLGSLWRSVIVALSGSGSHRSAFDPAILERAWPWCALATLLGILWCRTPQRRHARRLGRVLAIVWILPVMGAAIRHIAQPPPELRATMLAVGDGSSFFVESGSAVVVVDSGSSTSQRVGRDILLPALSEAGIGRVDAVVITHPDLDHFSAIPSLIESLPVGEVILTDFFMAAATHDAEGLPAELLRRIAAAGIPITIASRGTERTFGETTWTWLHPPADYRPERDNDSSQVICVEAAGRGEGDELAGARGDASVRHRGPRILFTGDLESRGAQVLLRERILDCDVCELPHHGAWQPGVAPLLRRVAPGLVIQSTAARRFERDRWRDVWRDLGSPARAVTCRDGAVRFEACATGELLLSRWDGVAWQSFGRVPRPGALSPADQDRGATPGIRNGTAPDEQSTSHHDSDGPSLAPMIAGSRRSNMRRPPRPNRRSDGFGAASRSGCSDARTHGLSGSPPGPLARAAPESPAGTLRRLEPVRARPP